MKRPRTRLTEIRLARGMTKAELARRSGVSPQTIQKVEDGSTKDVTPENREKLAPVLGVNPDQLVAPIGSPIIYRTGERGSMDEAVHKTLIEILGELRRMNDQLADLRSTNSRDHPSDDPHDPTAGTWPYTSRRTP